jgi:hypothetical protein
MWKSIVERELLLNHTDPYPKGGVAPLRHDLARYEYVMRQKSRADCIQGTDQMDAAWKLISKFASKLGHCFGRAGTAEPGLVRKASAASR